MKEKNTENGKGALPRQSILELIESGIISGVSNPKDSTQPSSMDLSIFEEGYEVKGVFLPKRNETVRDVLNIVRSKAIDPSVVLKKDRQYLFRLNEKFKDLPNSIWGYVNPKSSTGRVDLHARLISDHCTRFDGIPRKYSGDVWIHMIPKSFDLKIDVGMSFNQVRLLNSSTRLREFELEAITRTDPLVWDPDRGEPFSYDELDTSDKDGSIICGLGFFRDDHIGYVAKDTGNVLNLCRKDNNPDLFWEKIYPENGFVRLEKDRFYILATHEAIRVPPYLASEIVPMDERCGEFRSHYAGFFDPGWGYGKNGEGKGDIATLEVRPFEDMVIRIKQPICRFKFERMVYPPDVHYGEIHTSHYVGQKEAKLSKHFAPWG